jgi:hypothetical protein
MPVRQTVDGADNSGMKFAAPELRRQDRRGRSACQSAGASRTADRLHQWCLRHPPSGSRHVSGAGPGAGSITVVAVNSDDSVRLLGKGDERPLNTGAGPSCGPCRAGKRKLVTVFAERTPLAALTAVRPDIYAKGGDYDMTTIPESALVRTWGGQCIAVPFAHDRSTTALLARIRGHR